MAPSWMLLHNALKIQEINNNMRITLITTTLLLLLIPSINAQLTVDYSVVYDENIEPLENTTCNMSIVVDQFSDFLTFTFTIHTVGASSLNRIKLIQWKEPEIVFNNGEIAVLYPCQDLKGDAFMIYLVGDYGNVRVVSKNAENINDFNIWFCFSGGSS
jgi:hypothetical protein